MPSSAGRSRLMPHVGLPCTEGQMPRDTEVVSRRTERPCRRLIRRIHRTTPHPHGSAVRPHSSACRRLVGDGRPAGVRRLRRGRGRSAYGGIRDRSQSSPNSLVHPARIHSRRRRHRRSTRSHYTPTLPVQRPNRRRLRPSDEGCDRPAGPGRGFSGQTAARLALSAFPQGSRRRVARPPEYFFGRPLTAVLPPLVPDATDDYVLTYC